MERNPYILIGILKGQLSEGVANSNIVGSAAERLLVTIEALKEAIAAREQDVRDGEY